MKTLSRLLVVVISLLSISCATYRFEPIADENVEVKYDRGSAYALYRDSSIGMIIDPKIRNQEIMIQVFIKNYSSNALSIRDSDFRIESSDDRYTWKALKVYESREYYTKEKNAYIAGAVVMVLGSAANAASAGYGSSYSSGSVYGNNRYGSYSGTYSGSTRYYDPTAAELANQRNAANVANYAQNGKQWLETLENNLFYSKDLNPNEEYFGLIFSESDSAKYYKITCSNPDIKIVKIEYEKKSDQ